MFERPKHGERALLVQIGRNGQPPQDELDEFAELAASAGADVAATVTGTRESPHPRYYIGPGKLDEVGELVAHHGVDVVLVNHALSPSQERNLERELKCRVLDRSGLILDIFAQRARSFEGKLQVELAQLRHLSTRLVRGWTHLERQKGGIGLRGPGETQLETDRRLLGQRIKTLRSRLGRVSEQRELGRRNRRRAEVPTISLVGYTNAGKSTLFNRLTGAAVYAEDQLFATLDPTFRRLHIPGMGDVVLADTVGFIRELPHELVAAFRSTLQESRDADLLLHVVDSSDPARREHMEQVDEVLREIGATEQPRIEVFNKIDLTDEGPGLRRGEDGRIRRVSLSAASGLGIEVLLEAVAETLAGEFAAGTLRLAPAQARLRARLFDAGGVVTETADESGDWLLSLRLPRNTFRRLCEQESVDPETLEPLPRPTEAGFPLQSRSLA